MGLGKVTAGADFTISVGDGPSSVAAALGGGIVPTPSGGAGTADSGTAVELADGPGGTGPPAYAGETTPTVKAIETIAATTALRRRRKGDNNDSNQGREAEQTRWTELSSTGNYWQEPPTHNGPNRRGPRTGVKSRDRTLGACRSTLRTNIAESPAPISSSPASPNAHAPVPRVPHYQHPRYRHRRPDRPPARLQRAGPDLEMNPQPHHAQTRPLPTPPTPQQPLASDISRIHKPPHLHRRLRSDGHRHPPIALERA